METTYLVIGLAILVSSMSTGFIIFRMQGMHLMAHFIAIILALIATLAAVVTGMSVAVYAAVLLQFVVTITAYNQLLPTLKDSFQTSPGYSAHLALVTMLPVLALAALLMYEKNRRAQPVGQFPFLAYPDWWFYRYWIMRNIYGQDAPRISLFFPAAKNRPGFPNCILDTYL